MAKLTTAEFIDRANKIHDNKYTYPDEYINSNTKIKIGCKAHGEFMQSPYAHINQESGCKECGKLKNSLSLSNYLMLAQEKGIKFIALEIPKNINIKTTWQCCKGHIWETTYKVIKQGSSCPTCIKDTRYDSQRKTISQFIIEAKEIHHNTYNYSKTKYVNILTKVIIICSKEQHGEFSICPQNHIYDKQGCPKCYKELKKINIINHFIETAVKVHGDKYDYSKSNYIHGHEKICIVCKIDGHPEFYKNPCDHLRGAGCPKCNTLFLSEELCRDTLYNLLGKQFVKIRPDFLNGLELDGFNNELKLAFEYDGKQHYDYVPHFHRNGIKDFELQQEHDKNKIQICKQNNINIIKIPYTYSYTKPEKLIEYIIDQLYKLEYIIDNNKLSEYYHKLLIKIRELENILEGNTNYKKHKSYLHKLRELELLYEYNLMRQLQIKK